MPHPGAGVSPDGRHRTGEDACQGDSTDELALEVRRGPRIRTIPWPSPCWAGATVAAASPAPAWPTDLPTPAEPEKCHLFWRKVTDPAWRLPERAVAAADDIRVVLPEGPAFDDLRAHLAWQGIPFRGGWY
ncbi:hypothetical protein [Streptomyces sp. NPDC058751]|uniref:hypothetical protein n=1 Tax=Streptomyces sp. NPDC058751 TaxID=3346623 RepID=UPI0036CB6C0B